jgi:hypothetical protein
MIRAAALLVAVCGLSGRASARAGNEGPHGGDFMKAVFIIRAYEVLDALQTVPANAALLPAATVALLPHDIDETPIDTVDDRLYDDGAEVDALTSDDATSPTGKSIRLNRARWERLLSQQADLHVLVFHELLWVLGENDQNFRISRRLLMTSAPPQPPTPLPPLRVEAMGGITTYYVYYTDQPGTADPIQIMGQTNTIIIYLNPRRSLLMHLMGGVSHVFYDGRLTANFAVTREGGTLNYVRM